jgi:hypothetical protein
MTTPIVQWAVRRQPDEALIFVTSSRERAEAHVEKRYRWKEERRTAARHNLETFLRARELAGPPPMTTRPWEEWEKGLYGNPPIKDQEWELVGRAVTEWRRPQ